jgi:hypothetical protein
VERPDKLIPVKNPVRAILDKAIPVRAILDKAIPVRATPVKNPVRVLLVKAILVRAILDKVTRSRNQARAGKRMMVIRRKKGLTQVRPLRSNVRLRGQIDPAQSQGDTCH